MDFRSAILFEDEHIIAVNKPAGMVMYRGAGGETDTLVAAAHTAQIFLADTGDSDRPGVVHRLDRDTSGIAVLAKTGQAYQSLVEQWKGRKVEKEYVTLISGLLKPPKGAIDAPIGRHFRDRQKMGVMSYGDLGRNALTHYEVIESFDSPVCSLVRAYPKTGRTHQIRVHFKAIGHPVLGDEKYGNHKLNKKFEQEYGLTRQFLHAQSLTFMHPTTGKTQKIEAPLPHDLQNVLSLLQGRG